MSTVEEIRRHGAGEERVLGTPHARLLLIDVVLAALVALAFALVLVH